MDDLLDQLRRATPVPVAAGAVEARGNIRAAVADLLHVEDGQLERRWRWRPTDAVDIDVRYGFYRIVELLEEATARITATGEPRAKRIPPPGPADAALAAASAARWDLRGLVANLADPDLDRDPGGGEWSIRRTLGHIVGGQRSYALGTAWWLGQRDSPGPLPPRIPAGSLPPMPDEMDEARGSVQAILARLDDLLDGASARYGGLDAAALSAPARWAGLDVDVEFRLWRWGSHIREHAVQVDKTLVLTGRAISEVERLVRLVCATYGRLEATVYPRMVEAPTAESVSVLAATHEARRIAADLGAATR